MHHFMGHTLKLILLFGLTLASCADSSKQDTNHNNSLIDTTLQVDTPQNKLLTAATSLTNFDTLIVDRQAAVFIEPDTFKIKKRKKEIGEENFYAGADDYLYYMNTAHEFLDSLKLTTFETKDKKYVKFVSSDKTYQVINLHKLPELWNVYFFDPSKKAKQVDMTVIDEEYKSYFK